MGKKKQRKELQQLVATAQDAADRAERAASKARKQRKRIEAAAARLADVPTPEPTPEPAPEVASPAAGPAGPQVPAAELGTATKAQLLDLARSAGVPGRTRMSKEELVAALGR